MLHDNTVLSEYSALSHSVPVFSRSVGSWRFSIDRSAYDQEELAARYDRKSKNWHQVVKRHGFASAYKDLITRVLLQPRYQQAGKHLRVLDAGVGTGAMASAFREVFKGQLRLDAIDISASMLQQAKTRLEHPDTDLQLRRANLLGLPYANDTFDVVLAAHVIEHLPDPRVAMNELYRVLKPGGILICSITRTSILGACIQMIWRTHRVSRTVALGWLKECGLQCTCVVPFGKRTAARRFSFGYVGRKPSVDFNVSGFT